MTLNDYLRALRRAWRGALVLFILGMLVTVGVTATATKVYQATSMGFVTSNIAPTTGGDLQSINEVSAARAASYVDLATSSTIATNVQKKLGWSTSAGTLASEISVSQPTNTVLIEIDAKESTPERAAQLADAWMQALSDQVKNIEDPTAKGKSLRLQQVEAAVVPAKAISPNKRNNYVVGGVVSLLVGLIYALWRGFRPSRLRSADDFETAELPLAAAVVAPTTVAIHDGDADLDGLRQLRNQFLVQNGSLALAGVDETDDVSLIAARLAAVTAATGQRVAIIDADLHGHVVSSVLTSGDRPGLGEVLEDRHQLSSLLLPIEGSNAVLLPAGKATGHAADALAGVGFDQLLATLSQDYAVLVVTPPVSSGVTASVVGARCEHTVLVATAGKTALQATQRAIRQLGLKDGQFGGFLLREAAGRRKLRR